MADYEIEYYSNYDKQWVSVEPKIIYDTEISGLIHLEGFRAFNKENKYRLIKIEKIVVE